MAAVSGSDKSAAVYNLKTSSYSCSADLLNLLSGIDIFGKLGSACGQHDIHYQSKEYLSVHMCIILIM